MDLLGMTPCACCASTSLFLTAAVVVSSLYISRKIVEGLFPRSRWVKSSFKYISIIVSVLVALVAVAFGTLATNEPLRKFFFSKLIESMSAYPNPMDELRCKNIRNLSGRVLEIGPGPGTNFRCWQDHTEITEWVGVEPNENFRINETAASMNVTFPVRTVWLRGEDVDVLAESFDFVVGSHVLCSVGDVDQVLRQVRRALKPGGTYFFTEHVQAPHGLLRRAQQILEPFFFVLANGCTFRPLWESLSEETGLRGFQVHLEFLDAPMPIPFFVPHVSGWAVKYYV